MWLLLLALVASAQCLSKSHENITAFLTFRIDSAQIQTEIEKIGKEIRESEHKLAEFIEEINKLHITVDVYHIDQGNIANAFTAMEKLQKELCNLKKKVYFDRTDLFGSAVLFANLTAFSVETMKRIQEVSKRIFEENGLMSLNQYEYHPHMTIVELPKGQEDLGRELEQFKGLKVEGKQRFREILLCSVGKNTTGFYKIIDRKFIGSC